MSQGAIVETGKTDIPVWKKCTYRRPDAIDAKETEKQRIVIAGAGPVGLTVALDLAQKGQNVVVLTKLDFIAAGSKAICFSKRTLDVWRRLGAGDAMLKKGVQWNVGKVFRGDDDAPLFQFDLLPIKDQKNPGFINLQQYYSEEYLLDELSKYPNVDIRWANEVTAVEQTGDSVRVNVATPDGSYDIESEFLIACDGSHSPIRTMLGLDFEGRVFEDNFLIADVKFKTQRPPERWFWFQPPWPGASSLMHKQPDGVWRLDFQLGWDVDKREAVKPENVDPFVYGMLGDDVEFEYEWLSVYTFQCRRMSRFVHDRVIFAGDAAHLVSPFGARGCNGGVADADNLCWKLDLILRDIADKNLLETYNEEAIIIADENILNSSRATDFLTPKTKISEAFRDAVLDLSKQQEFARGFINSGRLSVAVSYPHSSLNTADENDWTNGVPPGSAAIDAPLDGENNWFLDHIGGDFSIVTFASNGPDTTLQKHCAGLISNVQAPVKAVFVSKTVSNEEQSVLLDRSGLIASRYRADDGATYLFRPDQYVAARWKSFDPEKIVSAISRSTTRGDK